MATPKRPFFLLALIFSGFFFSAPAYAECGGQDNCIAVSINPLVPPAHGTPLTSPPLDFGSLTAGTISPAKTIFVGAVTGTNPATLIAITLNNPADFRITTGGTCTVGSMLPHDGSTCTITVTFNPQAVGAKTATVSVATAAITRTVPLTGTGTLPAPVITSALAASGAAGVPFSGYQINADNNPTSFTASPLPPGLTMSASGAISGTPTLNGTYNTTITATNATGTDTKILVFTISLLAPVITSGSTASGITGQAFSYQITATNSPTSFTASPLPPGLTISASGAILGTPTAGGTYNVSVTATNATGTASQAVTITIGLVVPTAPNVSIDVSLNTPRTVDLAPFITGPFISGIRITAAPAHVLVPLAVSGTVVTYTPANNYFGPDAFSYVAFSNDGTSPPAVVTVNVVGRPDPSQDPLVRGLIGSQAETAKRFSRAQILNFQRRMESLHRGAGDSVIAGATGFGPGRGLGSSTSSGPVMGRSPVANPGVNVSSIGSAADIAGNAQPGQSPLVRMASEPGGLRQMGPAGAASGLLPTSFVTTLLNAASTRSVNLSNSSDRADGSSGLPDGTGLWIGGSLNFGTRDQTSDSNSLRFSTDGISAGIDRRFSDKLTLGMGLGYARDKTDIGIDGTKSMSRGSSVALYGSYQPTKNTFVDGLIGYGVLSNDTDRYVASVADFARAHRKGDQWFGSVAAGYEHRKDGLLLSPYGRLDFANDRLKEATETGAGLNALTYFEQKQSSLQLSLGLRAESAHETNFGWALPRLRVEFRHDLEGNRDATIAYADQFAGPRYSVTPSMANRDSLLIGIGSDFVFRNGLKLGVDYQAQRSFGPDRSEAVRFWLSKELDGKGLPSGLMSSKLFDNPVRIEAGYAWDDNLNREHSLKLSDHIYSLNVSKSAFLPVTSHTRVVVNGILSGDKLYTYTGLDRYSGGGHAEFQYRTSGEFDAPTFGIFGRVLRDQYSSELRTGYRYSFGVTARQSLTDRIDAFGALASNVRNARSDVFDARDYSARFSLDYSLGRAGALYLGGEYRRGDAVSTGPRSIDSIAIATAIVQDDAYGNGQLFAYRFDARTVLWTLGYNWPLGARDSIDFSWRRARSTPTGLPNYALAAGYGTVGTPMGLSSYTANQFSVVYLMRF